VALQVSVAGGNAARAEVLHHTGVRQGVEVTAHDDWDSRHPRDWHLEPDPPLRLGLHDDVVELIGEHEGLDVCKLRVTVDVGFGHQDVLAGHVHGVGVLHFQQSCYANMTG
jgi:hypothetical protein